jgi:hypothetical protein
MSQHHYPQLLIIAATLVSLPLTNYAQAAGPACAVDVTDWPIGTLPDNASAAFGPTTLAACMAAVADWPVGQVPDNPAAVFSN